MQLLLGVLFLFLICPVIGGLPLIHWITVGLTGKRLAQLGTGNVSVSAAFYHGGQGVGILAVLSEAMKGIVAVLGTRYFFPQDPTWEIVSLIALVMGRYGFARGAGTTNVFWGFIVHDWATSLLVFVLGGVGFTLVRERHWGRIGILVLLVFITALRYPNEGSRIGAVVTLCIFMGWIYQKIPDDLELPTQGSATQSRQMFRFFRGDRAILTLDHSLHSRQVGQKAATLSRLKRWGYPVPPGWVLPPADDPAPLIEHLHPSVDQPLMVRSSAIGEDSAIASAAGQYESIGQVTNSDALSTAIARCQMSYNRPTAVQYRRDRQLPDEAMAVLVQVQVRGVFSGVAFSRDPIARSGDAVVIEALPGAASQVVSGQMTPEQYRVELDWDPDPEQSWLLPDDQDLPLDGAGDVPPRLIQQVAYLARHLEVQFHGVPQDVEWSYDGQHLWLLQSRPITTLLPIWTRKIAAEVIPGVIHPLTWSINRPLTCGVWGKLFTLVLGDRAQGLDFGQTATLHHSAAYFNATLLGRIFRRMGLPANSLEFLTRGAPFRKPPLRSTLRNLPGLFRLLGAELRLVADFQRDDLTQFQPELQALIQQNLDNLAAPDLLNRVDRLLTLLERATYYSILAPLSLAIRQAMLQVNESELDNSRSPEIASLRSLQTLAIQSRHLMPNWEQLDPHCASVTTYLAEHPDGRSVLEQLDDILDRYGYLSQVATDIAIPRWRDDPQPVWELFAQLLCSSELDVPPSSPSRLRSWKHRWVQIRLDLKGRVTALYSRLLAELRWSIVALEQQGLEAGYLTQSGDLFFLTLAEIRQYINPDPELPILSDSDLGERITQRRSQFEQDRPLIPPRLVYGNDPPNPTQAPSPSIATGKILRGIGASPGWVEGRVKVMRSLQSTADINRSTILVVPYTDSGWSPVLARCGGLIAEVGGRLSHGAIVAREYGIPAVMDIHNATQRLRDGQRVRLDGTQGIVECL